MTACLRTAFNMTRSVTHVVAVSCCAVFQQNGPEGLMGFMGESIVYTLIHSASNRIMGLIANLIKRTKTANAVADDSSSIISAPPDYIADGKTQQIFRTLTSSGNGTREGGS